MAGRIGLETEVFQLTTVERSATADELAGLQCPKNSHTNILYVSRVVAVAGEPVAFLVDICPQEFLRIHHLGTDFHGSVFDIFLKSENIHLAYSRTEILAENASENISNLLKVPRETALIKLTARLFTQEEQLVDYSLSYFIPGHFRFHVNRRIPYDPFDKTKNNHR
jgi:GntR family transcriptional regulator